MAISPRAGVRFFIIMICLLCSTQVSAQSFVWRGRVTNEAGTPLAGSYVFIEESGQQTVTDAQGFFSITLHATGRYNIIVSHTGYHVLRQIIELGSPAIPAKFILKTASVELQEVIVKDRHVEQRKETDAMNVEIAGNDFIRRNLGGSLMKSLERMPGIKTIGIGSGQSKPLIRGLGFNRVVVVEKGLKHEGQQWGADHGLEIDQFAAHEVELVKGAASFAYGSDAIGGVIDIKPAPAPPVHSLGGSVELVGKTNNNLYGGSLNVYGRNKKLFFDARVTIQDYGDYRVPTDRVYVYDYAVDLYKNFLRNTAGQENGLHLNAGYVTERFRGVFYISNTFSRSGFFANAHGMEPRRVDAAMHDASSRDILMPNQEVNHFKVISRNSYQWKQHRLELEAGYQHNFRQEFSQYVNHGYMPPVFPDTLSVQPNLERGFDKRVYSFNLRDEITLGRHTVKAGISGEQQNNTISGWTFLVPAFKQTSAGVFVYDKFEVNDKILLHAAARYDYSLLKMFRYQDWFSSEVNDDGAQRSEYLVRAGNLQRRFSSFVWSLGMNYNREQFRFKANIGKSFRIPIAKELGANGVNYHYFSYERGDATLSPEQSYQADVSVVYDNINLLVTLSPFYNYFPNYIYLNPTPYHDYFYGAGNQVFEYSQSRVVRYGGELQVKYQWHATLSTEVLGEYLYAEQVSGSKKGYTLPFSPPASVLFNVGWSPAVKHLQNTYFSVDYRLTGAQNNIVPPEKKTKGYQVVNLQAGTQLKLSKQPLIVRLQIQNLFNTRYLNHTSFYRLIELPEAGRNIILSLKLPFQLRTAAKQ